MTTSFDMVWKQNDTWPPQPITLEQNGVPIDLTGAEAVHLYMLPDDPEGELIKTAALTIADAEAGLLEYTPEGEAGLEPADLATPGPGKFEFRIKWSSTKSQSVPKVGYLTYNIEPELNP